MNSKTSEIFEFNKMIFIYIIAILVGSTWLLEYFLSRPKHSYKPFFLGILLIFFATQLISSFYSIDTHTSLYGYYGRWNGGLVSLIAYIALFFVFVQTFTKKEIDRVLAVSLGSSAVVIVWGLLAKYGYDFSCKIFTGHLSNTCWTNQFQPAERMFATIGQPNWLGAYLAIHFFIAMYFLFKHIDVDEIKNKGIHVLERIYGSGTFYLMCIYLILNVLSLWFTKSRSSLLALGIAGIIGLIFVFTKGIKRYAALVIITAVILVIMNNTSRFKLEENTTPNSNVTDSFDIRKIVWKGAIDLGLKYPYFGTGPETFAYSYYFTRPLEHNRTSEWDFLYNKAHNEYLNYFANTGFVGLAGYASVILGTLFLCAQLYREKEKHDQFNVLTSPSFFLLLSYLTILVTNFFGFSVSTIQIFFYVIPAICLAELGKNKQDVHDPNLTPMTVPLLQKIAIVGVFLVGLGCLGFMYQYYSADLHYTKAKADIAQEDYLKAMLELDRANKLKYEHVYEDKLSNVLAYLAFQSSFQNKKYSADLITLSKLTNYKSLISAPENMLYWKTQAKNYYLYYQVSHDTKDLEKSIRAMKHATLLAPTDAQTRYSLAVLYLTMAQESKDLGQKSAYQSLGKQTLNEVLKMKPDYSEAQNLLKGV